MWEMAQLRRSRFQFASSPMVNPAVMGRNKTDFREFHQRRFQNVGVALIVAVMDLIHPRQTKVMTRHASPKSTCD